MSALALSTLKLGLRHVNEVFGLSRLRHPGPILGRFPPRFSQVVMRLVAVMLFRIRFLFLALDSFIVIFGVLVLEKEFKFYKSRFILRSQLRKSFKIVVLFVLICIESTTILKETRFAQLAS